MERVIGSGDPLPSPIKKNGLIMLWIIYLLGSFIGKNGLIIGNRFTALQKEPSGGWPNPQVSLHLSRISFRVLVHDQSQVLQTTGGARRGLLFLLFISMRARTMAARYFYQE